MFVPAILILSLLINAALIIHLFYITRPRSYGQVVNADPKIGHKVIHAALSYEQIVNLITLLTYLDMEMSKKSLARFYRFPYHLYRFFVREFLSTLLTRKGLIESYETANFLD